MGKEKKAKIRVEFIQDGIKYQGEVTINLCPVEEVKISGPTSPVGHAKAEIEIDKQVHLLRFSFADGIC